MSKLVGGLSVAEGEREQRCGLPTLAIGRPVLDGPRPLEAGLALLQQIPRELPRAPTVFIGGGIGHPGHSQFLNQT